jgi:hypothetical protein
MNIPFEISKASDDISRNVLLVLGAAEQVIID